MKKLSIEQKAKRYDEAIEIARQINNEHRAQCADVMTKVFPELTESEDEKIRKYIIDYFKGNKEELSEGFKWNGITVEQVIAWLEKQGEQKSININISEFDTRLNKLLIQFESLSKEELTNSLSFYLNVIQNDGTYKEQKPVEWSEEDEQGYQDVLLCIKGYKDRYYSSVPNELSRRAEKFLTSLKKRYLLQPKQEWSEEDEKMFEHIIAKATLHFSSINYLDEEEINFLKSLRHQNRWKPSDEQMGALLSEVTAWTKGCPKQIVLESLYNDLKKL